MKLPIKFVILSFSLSLLPSLKGQNSFQNLGFESANLAPVPQGQFGGPVATTNALPSWTGYLGTNQTAGVLQNNFTLGTAAICILTPNWTTAQGIIEGQFTALLQAGANGIQGTGWVSAAIAQTGMVPVNSRSVQVKVFGNNFSVNFAGQNISLLPIGGGANYTLFGGDISQFAGQTGELRLTALQPGTALNNVYFDSVTFSTQPVPEPSGIALIALGFLAIGFHKLRKSLRP